MNFDGNDESSSSKDSSPAYSDYFDEVIGHIENLVMDEAFQNILNHFMESYYKDFDNNEENKMEYMEIFRLYTTAIERYITDSLNKRLGYFDMERFAMELEWVDADVFQRYTEMLFFQG